MSKPFQIAVIAGDGIGQEVMPEGLRVLKAAAQRFDIPLQFNSFEWMRYCAFCRNCSSQEADSFTAQPDSYSLPCSF